MSDIIELLREGIEPSADEIPQAEQIMDLAADEIERLRSVLKMVLDALRSEFDRTHPEATVNQATSGL